MSPFSAPCTRGGVVSDSGFINDRGIQQLLVVTLLHKKSSDSYKFLLAPLFIFKVIACIAISCIRKSGRCPSE